MNVNVNTEIVLPEGLCEHQRRHFVGIVIAVCEEVCTFWLNRYGALPRDRDAADHYEWIIDSALDRALFRNGYEKPAPLPEVPCA